MGIELWIPIAWTGNHAKRLGKHNGKDPMKAKARILVAIALCFTCLAVLVGCADTSEQDDVQAKNRQYMSSVNQIMETLNTNMDGFVTAVKEGEVVSLSSQLSAVDQCVSDLNALDVPDAMSDIHASYVEGATELQTALKDYVDLYEEVKVPASGSYDYDDYQERLKDIQSHYDAGIKALEEADEAAQAA